MKTEEKLIEYRASNMTVWFGGPTPPDQIHKNKAAEEIEAAKNAIKNFPRLPKNKRVLAAMLALISKDCAYEKLYTRRGNFRLEISSEKTRETEGHWHNQYYSRTHKRCGEFSYKGKSISLFQKTSLSAVHGREAEYILEILEIESAT